MKTLLLLLALLPFASAQETEKIILLPAPPKEAPPLFYSATASVSAQASLDKTTSQQTLIFSILQGTPETLTLALTGEGEITSLNGENLRDWSVRIAPDGARFLDIRPVIEKDVPLKTLTFQLRTLLETESPKHSLLLPAPGPSSGFSLNVSLDPTPGTDLRVTRAQGLFPLESGSIRQFISTSTANLNFTVTPTDASSEGLELIDSKLLGTLSEDGNNITFTLTATARAESPESTATLLSGNAALTSLPSSDTHHIALDEDNAYTLIADTSGDFPLSVEFVVPLSRNGDYRALAFTLPAGVVVPLSLTELPTGVSFDPDLPVVPRKDASIFTGFIPADGRVSLAFKKSTSEESGTLFFNSTAITDMRVSSGLLRQFTAIDLRILQGKLPSLSLALDGPGEILAVSGPSILAWSISEKEGARTLDLKLSRPIEASERITIESRAALGAFPVEMQALRISPIGALRHSGFLRIANDGAVRIEVADAQSLIQLAPDQFPGGTDESLRQVFAYRFPSADFSYRLLADQILPEVGVTEVTVHELAETDRRILADLELDIREAPLRDWELDIPADHAVASVTGAEVADYALASEQKSGLRRLKIIFKNPVIGRQLISIRLEKNEAAKAGAWSLQPLVFPGAKFHRGYIGAVSTPGYRLAAGETTGVAEVPVTFFPRKTVGLQQAFRIRETSWRIPLTIEALGQSIQADVFHLYSLKAGAAYGSVLINTFVVGAPATEWRVSVPESIDNIDVTGQNVGRDWRREGDTVIIPLSRPILGAGTVLLTFEQPMPSSGGQLSPGEIRPLGVQSERGYIQIVSPLQVKFSTETSDGPLLPIDPTELPAEFRLLSTAPTLAAWQYTAREFTLATNIEWYVPGETADQVVDFLKLSTQISRDGQWVTDARFFVKSKGRSALRTILPEGTNLWEARVNGQPVNARKDGNETLIPLPATSENASEVTLRYGAESKKPSRPTLTAPILDAPIVIGEWTVSGDENRTLIPRENSAANLTSRPPTAPTGWQWLARHPFAILTLLILTIAAFVTKAQAKAPAIIATALLLIAAIFLALKSITLFSMPNSTLEYSAPVVATGQAITLDISNLPHWQAATPATFYLLLILGITTFIVSFVKESPLLKPLGIALIAASLLSIHNGAPIFFAALTVVAASIFPWRQITSVLPKSKTPAATALLLLSLFLVTKTQAAEKPAESIIQTYEIKDNRLLGTMEITLRAEAGDRFLLLDSPATLTSFNGLFLNVSKQEPIPDNNDKSGQKPTSPSYYLTADISGRLTATATFEMPLASPAKGFRLPSGPAAMRKVTLRWDQPGWEFRSPAAASITPLDNLPENSSGATLILGPTGAANISATPTSRDISSEKTEFFADVSNLFLPAPGAVSARHRISIRPTRGIVSEIIAEIPKGFTVSEITDGPAGAWRFDPATRRLRIPIEPAQDKAFSLNIHTQRSTAILPVDLTLAPLRVEGSSGEVGFIALAFGNDAQAEAVETTGLSRVNLEDFDSSIIPHDRDGNALALIRHTFRYGKEEASASLKVTAVAPELRSESWTLLSLGEDRLVLSTDLAVNVTRSGIFRLAVEIPADLEIETATGQSLSHWTESTVGKKRLLTLHLNGKTLGLLEFNITLTGRPPGDQENWQVPRLSLDDASRETGVLTIVPDRGLRVRAVDRKNISQIDPRELTDTSRDSTKAAARPGALAYRLLQADWSLGIAISRLDPWITASVFHETTLREGQSLTRASINYRIENAALKSLRLRIPGLDETSASTVRATGDAVADLLPIEGEEGLYEIRFQRGIAGNTTVEIEYQQAAGDTDTALIQPLELPGTRQLTYFSAVRAGGRLELETPALPRGWQKADWAAVRPVFGQSAGTTAPLLLFRVADPESPLAVSLKRHDLANLRKLRVSKGTLTTLLSPTGSALTAVDLELQVTAKGTLRLRLPEKSGLFNVLVNDEGATLVREKSEWLFHVSPSPDPARPATVRFVYSTPADKNYDLQGPVLNTPMENLTWRVIIPETWTLTDHSGDFDLTGQSSYGSFDLVTYESTAASKKEASTSSAVALLDQANSWLASGDQEKASEAFSNLVRTNQLDAASGEDARVQLRELKTQQAVLGLNTRRQKVQLDNRADNAQLEQAANANPVFNGDYNYDPTQYDRFLQGNSVEENSALKDIATRIVTQQLAAEPAPTTIDPTIPERGQTLTFHRSVQVSGDSPMLLSLDLKPARSGFPLLAIPLCIIIGLLATRRKQPTHPAR